MWPQFPGERVLSVDVSQCTDMLGSCFISGWFYACLPTGLGRSEPSLPCALRASGLLWVVQGPEMPSNYYYRILGPKHFAKHCIISFNSHNHPGSLLKPSLTLSIPFYQLRPVKKHAQGHTARQQVEAPGPQTSLELDCFQSTRPDRLPWPWQGRQSS